SEQTIVSKRYNFEHKGTKNQVLLYFDNPTFNILQRSTLILFTCLVVFIITVWSFYRLIQTIRKQRRISEIKDDFIDGMTHELLTPISTLKIALESLEKMDNLTNTTRSKEYFDVSGQALDRINDIVQNVLYSSLHDGGNVKLEFEKINLNDLLEGLLDYHKNRTEGDLELSLQKLENPWITSDRQHLTNVIHNLLDNAIKYSDSKPVKVSVVAKRFANEVSIVVNDNGIGIPENEQNKIFEKFYRGNHFQKNINGLGIGLYYVKNILNRLNGRIELLSSSQLGSSFRVSLNTNKTDHG
ncbi:MAG: HAMP domain-containing histidine kinase, partial [Roseivirga sp.]|nr:HAMP domain-containing histidine kinase [Roseivirga sp.]